MESICQLTKVLLAEYLPSLFFSQETIKKEYPKLFPLKEKIYYILEESGYMHIQSTKPDTIAAGLVDSPVGLAAYILEKFSTWTNPENRNKEKGGLTEKFTLDELLTNVMIYWTSGNIAASQRFYKENLSQNELAGYEKGDTGELDTNDSRLTLIFVDRQKVLVPAATVDAPHEMVRTPRLFVQNSYANLVQYSDFERGGHFTAFEEPQLVADDIRLFVGKVLKQEEEAKRAQEKQKKEEI